LIASALSQRQMVVPEIEAAIPCSRAGQIRALPASQGLGLVEFRRRFAGRWSTPAHCET
jgi:hypothetical protein